jgi:hypothetical protein
MRILVLILMMSVLSHSAFASSDDGYGSDNGYGHFVTFNNLGKKEVSAAEEEKADEGPYGLADYGYVTSEDETTAPAAAAAGGGAGAGDFIFRLSTLPPDSMYLHPAQLKRKFALLPIKRVEEIRQELSIRRVPTPTPRDSDDGAYSDLAAKKCLRKYLRSIDAKRRIINEQYYYATQFISIRSGVAALPCITNAEIADYCIKRWKGENLEHTVVPTLLREQVSPAAIDTDFRILAKVDIIYKINYSLKTMPKQPSPKLSKEPQRSKSSEKF